MFITECVNAYIKLNKSSDLTVWMEVHTGQCEHSDHTMLKLKSDCVVVQIKRCDGS